MSLPAAVGIGDGVAQAALDELDRSNLHEVMTSYFEGVHAWFPILSPKRFIEASLNPWADRRADNILLLLCMKLVSSFPSTPEKWDKSQRLYEKIKRYQLDLQLVGCYLSLQYLQAELLIAVYEFGHVLYPAAYLTIGSCARLGTALGIDKIQAEQIPRRGTGGYVHIPWTMADEENSRAWWAATILDRFALLGDEGRPLCINDPDMDSLLPVDDADWDNGVCNKILQPPLPPKMPYETKILS